MRATYGSAGGRAKAGDGAKSQNATEQTPAVIDAHTPTRRRDSERRRSAPGSVIIPKSFGEQH